MGLFRRILNIAVGLAAGALAYKVLGDYNKNQTIEGEFTVVNRDEGEDGQKKKEQGADAD